MRLTQRLEFQEIYRRLLKTFGPQHWWPASSAGGPGEAALEVMVGAVLTQNTNWGNVEKAIHNLKTEKVLSVKVLNEISQIRLAQLIRPSGYFNIKAKRIKNLIHFIVAEYKGDIKKMKAEPLAVLRGKLLAVNGIGPETADSILLYALDKPVFVIDAYTKRFMDRHNMAVHDVDYHHLQKMFMNNLSADLQMFNEYHALIVRLGKEFCRPTPLCESCPLNDLHYSVIYKCRRCHRALPEKKERVLVSRSPKAFHCRSCHDDG